MRGAGAKVTASRSAEVSRVPGRICAELDSNAAQGNLPKKSARFEILGHQVFGAATACLVERGTALAGGHRPMCKPPVETTHLPHRKRLLTYAKKVTVSVLYWYARSFRYIRQSLDTTPKGVDFFLPCFSPRGEVMGKNEGVRHSRFPSHH